MDKDQLRRLLRVTPTVAVGETAGAFVACYDYLAKGATWPVFAWLGLFSLVSLARLGIGVYYNRGGAARLSASIWYRWTAAGVMAHALLWGACSWVLFDLGDPVAESVLHIVLASIYISAPIHLSGFYPLLTAYVLSVAAPLVLRDVWIGSPDHLLLALMCTITGIYAMSNGRSLSRTFAELLEERRRNAGQIEALHVENRRSEVARLAAEQAIAAKSRFFAAANHDLRQPLHAMGLLAQTLRSHSSRVNADEVSQHLVKCVNRMAEVVEELLEITRLDVGNVTPKLSAFAIDELIHEICHTYEPEARTKGLRMLVRAQTSAIVRSDRALLGRVLANLVSNAIRYTAAGLVCVVADAQEESGDVELCVEDTGIGIAAEQLPHIFEEFYQVGNPARDLRLGLGLGLFTVKRLSDLLSLAVSVRSAPGVGSAFRLKLPRAHQHEGLAPPNPGEDTNGMLAAPRRVLLVEDDADSRHALLALMQLWGCDCRGADNAAAAVLLLQRGFSADVLVVALGLADVEGGVDAVHILRDAAGSALPALIVIGDVGNERMREVQHQGFTVLAKPVKPMQLRAFLGQAFAVP